MKLIYYELDFVAYFDKGKTYSIVLESPMVFEKFLIDLYNYINKIERPFAVYNDETEMDFAKCCEIVLTPFDITYNRREIQKKLFGEICNELAESEIINNLCDIHSEFLKILDNLKFLVRYDIEYEEEFNITDILKNYNVQIKNPTGRFVERIIEYMITLHSLLGKDFFIIANCDVYLDTDDYLYIEQCAAYYNLCVVFVRNRQLGLHNFEKEYIIDKDLCEIH